MQYFFQLKQTMHKMHSDPLLYSNPSFDYFVYIRIIISLLSGLPYLITKNTSYLSSYHMYCVNIPSIKQKISNFFLRKKEVNITFIICIEITEIYTCNDQYFG